MYLEEKEMNFDRMLHVIKNEYDSSDEALNLFIQNIVGFSAAIAIQFLRGKVTNNPAFNETLIKSFFGFLFLDNLIINLKRNKFEKDKKEAREQMRAITNNLKKNGINVEESDVINSVKEKITSYMNYYYMIDMFNSIVPVSRAEIKKDFLKKDIVWMEGIDRYDRVSLYKIGSIATTKDGSIKVFGEKEKVNKDNYDDVKTYYELGYIQDEEIGIINFSRNKDDINILSTEGDIEKKDIKEKYLKLGLILQHIKYKDSFEVNKIIKKKIQ